MVFESLSEKLQSALGKLKGKGKISEKDLDLAMREVRLALLEADVNFKVVKDFVKTVKERALGSEVMESLTPGQQVIKIVNDELTRLMGEKESKINFASSPPTVILMCGLQGAGKTTTTGKLAFNLKKQNKRPLLVACDVYRPAAIKQLEVVGERVGVPVFSMGDKINPVDIAKAALEHGKKHGNDVIIVDTGAGIADAVLEFLVASGEILLVTTPEPTSITDSYSLLKALYRHPRYQAESTTIKMLANRVDRLEEGQILYNKLNAVVSRYLKLPFSYLGSVPQDDKLMKSVMQQTPVSMLYPNAKSAMAYEEIAAKLMNKEEQGKQPRRGMAAFFSHMITGKNR